MVTPTLTAYLPDSETATGSAVVIAPGGGLMMLAMDSEGHDVAQWLAERGVAAFVLKYRLNETPRSEVAFTIQLLAMLDGVRRAGAAGTDSFLEQADVGTADAIQAIKLVRSRSAEWGYAPDHVGLVGFSAGAFITTRVLADPDPSLRPDFAAALYGGAFASDADIPRRLPPLFVAVARDDDLLADATVAMVDRLRSAGYDPGFHLYASGGHGFGMSRKGHPSDQWIDHFYEWMEENDLLR